MSSTSLEKQLKKLTVPQTSILSLGYKKTSLLIQPQDIGNHDIIAFFEVGLKGFDELCSINPKFKKFEKTLFSQSWQSKQRAILSLPENKKIDLLIEEFLCLLSPYLNSKPALYALEWLVHRFNIEQYNTDVLIGFSLPFLTTQVFTRLVQVIPLQSNPEVAKNWWWLTKSKRTGVQINEKSFISEAVNDTKLLKLICSFIIKIVNEHENCDELITVWTNFYTKIAVAAFKQSTISKNNLVTIFLPSIIAGLESEAKAFTVSAFIVIGVMSTHITYTEKLRSSLVKKIMLVKHQQLWQNCTLLLCVVYNSVKDIFSVKLSNSCVKYLANHQEIHMDSLKKVLNNENNVFYLLLVKESLKLAKNDQSLQSFCLDLVKLIDLNDDNFVTELVKVILKSVIEEVWYEDLLKIIKTKYNKGWENVTKSIEFSKNQDMNGLTLFNAEEIATNVANNEIMDVDCIINDSNSKKRRRKKKNIILSKQYSSVDDQIQTYCENIWNGSVKVKNLCEILHPLIMKSEPSIIALSRDNIVIPTLLCCLTQENQQVRKSVIICLKEINKNYKIKNLESYHWLVKQIVDKHHEILVDNDQVRLVLMISLQLKTEDAKKILNILFETACNSVISCGLRLKMFDLLSAVNTPDVCTNVLSHGLELLQNTKLNIAESHIIKFVIDKLHPNFVEWDKMWHISEKYMSDTNPKLNFGDGKLSSPANIFIQNLTLDMFNTMPDDLKLNLIKTLLDLQARVEDNDIIDSVKSFIHEVSFDSILFISHLEKMSLDTFNSIKWKNGIALLELIQNKSSLENVTQLVPVLFDILKTCLTLEDQSSLLEYTKQLCLSCILNCCMLVKSDTDKLKVSEHLNLELIVSVMRSSLNQQTQYHALILLSNCAQMVPDQIILHVMTIFTFMGSSVMRQDDEYTFNITCQVLNTIIPILLKEGRLVIRKALSVFARSVLDIPEHRRSTLLKFLVQALNTNYLWELIVLVHKEYLSGTIVIKNGVSSNTICLDICSDCPINVMLDTCNNLLKYYKFLELKKGDVDQTTLIDISNYSENKIYKLKYCLVSFLNNLLSSYMFVSKVMYCTTDKMLKDGFTEMIKSTLWFIQNQNSISSKNSTPIKYHTILDKINALLPLDIFVDAINYILTFVDLKSTQHRTMDLLNKRLLETKSLSQEQSLKLLEPLSVIVNMSSSTVQDDFIVKQTALISITLITKCSDINDNLEVYQGILQKVTKSVQDSSVGPLLGTYVLCIAELVSSLKTKAITCFSLIIPTVISILHKLNENCIMADGALLPSILSGLLRIISELKNFLSPYIVKLIYELALLSGTCNDSSLIGNENYKSIIRTKFQLLGEKMSEIPNRVLEPAMSSTLIEIIKHQKYSAFQYLLNIAKNSFNNTMSEEFTVFLLKSLEFCCLKDDSTEEKAVLVETSVITTITEIALKCSESTFRTFYHKLYEWKNNLNNDKCVMIYFRLLNALSSELKGLFLLFAGNIIPTANSILTKCKSDSIDGKILLIEHVVSTLSNVFKYDTVNFVTKERFEMIMNPLVDILEATDLENHNDICLKHVIPCISNLIAAVTDDTLWKEINCQIMLKARHRLPAVRSLCVDATLAIAERLGENFLPLLPDSIPFLAELMEDEQEEIEQKTRKAIQQMEKYVNEPIESYFC